MIDILSRMNVHDLFYTLAYQRLSTLKRWDNFPEWMYSIIKNLCNKWWQSQLRQPDREFVEEIDTEILNQPSIGLHREIKMHSSLHEALTTLPEMYRQVLSLYYLGGYKSREIGESLGISKNTVDTRLRRAKNLLREEMQQSISCEERDAFFGMLPVRRLPTGKAFFGMLLKQGHRYGGVPVFLLRFTLVSLPPIPLLAPTT